MAFIVHPCPCSAHTPRTTMYTHNTPAAFHPLPMQPQVPPGQQGVQQQRVQQGVKQAAAAAQPWRSATSSVSSACG